MKILCLLGIFLHAQLSLAETHHQPTCGYESCPKSDPRKLNVHLLPFTINEIGYLKTVESFYDKYAKHQINSAISALSKDPARRFTYTDVIFLHKWWQHQNESRRDALRQLVNDGRFEIVNGGWVPNDEAVTHYQSIIDQYTWGLRRLNDTLGSCARPRVGWHINSHAHSREQASIFAQMGFDGAFVAHVNPIDKSIRYGSKIAEVIWDSSPSLGKSSYLFTSILTATETPRAFCYDAHCGGRIPIIDDPLDVNYNVEARALYLMALFKDTARKYKTNNVNFLLGGHNFHVISELWFSNFDKIIKHINEKNGTLFNIFYSTPSCYLKSLNDQNATWPVKQQDFIPYSSDYHSYHTGYYSSKPSIKFFERQGNNFLQITKQLSVLSSQSDSPELQSFREKMAQMQSVHAVTGNHAVNMGSYFVKKLYERIENAKRLTSKALNKLSSKKEHPHPPAFHSCLSLNVSACKYSTEHKSFVVTVYNPTSRNLNTYVRLPVRKGTYEVKDYLGNNVVIQMIPIPETVLKIPGRSKNATMELVFRAKNVNALGYKAYYVHQTSDEGQFIQPSMEQSIGMGDSSNVSVVSHGRVLVNCTKDGKTVELHQSFQYYESAKNASHRNPLSHSGYPKINSGMVIFSPKKNKTHELSGSVTYQVYQGPLVEEIHQVVNEWVSQVISIYNDTDYVEFNWLIGPIPLEHRNGKEIITMYSSNLKSSNEFFTDSNGRGQITRRTKVIHTGSRHSESVSSNYYPVTTKIAIEDKNEKARVSVLVDRSEGGTSLHDGEIELMLHRRIPTADHVSGAVGAVNEMAFGRGTVVRGKHRLLISNSTDFDETLLREKEVAVEMNSQPWLFFTPVSISFDEWRDNFKMKSDEVIKGLPRHVRILTLEPWKNGKVLLRLENLFETKESNGHAGLAEVHLKELFHDFTVTWIRETSLGANQWLNEVHRLKWQAETTQNQEKLHTYWFKTSPNIYHTDNSDHRTKEEHSSTTEIPHTHATASPEDPFVVRLKPMEIRTFVLKMAHKVVVS